MKSEYGKSPMEGIRELWNKITRRMNSWPSGVSPLYIKPVFKPCTLNHETILKMNDYNKLEWGKEAALLGTAGYVEWVKCPECNKPLEEK